MGYYVNPCVEVSRGVENDLRGRRWFIGEFMRSCVTGRRNFSFLHNPVRPSRHRKSRLENVTISGRVRWRKITTKRGARVTLRGDPPKRARVRYRFCPAERDVCFGERKRHPIDAVHYTPVRLPQYGFFFFWFDLFFFFCSLFFLSSYYFLFFYSRAFWFIVLDPRMTPPGIIYHVIPGHRLPNRVAQAAATATGHTWTR